MNAVTARGSDFKAAYKQIAPAILQALPSHIPAERFERAAMVAVQRNPDLLTKADRRSLLMAVQRAAQDGLLPDGREGAIVLFRDQAQWMPMVAGLMKLARNSGEIASINAHVAYKGETFRVTLGDEEKIEHERSLDLADGAEPVAVYAVAVLKSGEKIREVMTWKQVMRIKAVSRSPGGPWTQWPDEMARKSCIRRLSKRLPLSTDRDGDDRFQRAAESTDYEIDGTVAPADLTSAEPASKLDMLENASADDLPIEGDLATDEAAMDLLASLAGDVHQTKTEADLNRMLGNAAVKKQIEKLAEAGLTGRWLEVLDQKRRSFQTQGAAA